MAKGNTIHAIDQLLGPGTKLLGPVTQMRGIELMVTRNTAIPRGFSLLANFWVMGYCRKIENNMEET